MSKNRELIPIPIVKTSLFAPSLKNWRNLVIFVHGFRGEALSTWLAFPDLADDFESLRNADLLFYGYASKPQRVQNMAINLRSDIDAIWGDPTTLGPEIGEFLFEREKQVDNKKHPLWDRILFVAHSLGCVILRRALYDCHLDKANLVSEKHHWSTIAELCLFAPAHSGANVLRLIGETSSAISLPLAPALKVLYPCLLDLEEGSTALIGLREDYHALSVLENKPTMASAVILAENDRVVDPSRFPGDPVPVQINGQGHISVCKPKKDFLEPIFKVSEILIKNKVVKNWPDSKVG
ncbi:MAG TPA: hypothetical protein DDY32_16525 [Desulfobulbaceae bacterium]|nr:hypothetical protein [Desulfobulbaceae bacterium]